MEVKPPTLPLQITNYCSRTRLLECPEATPRPSPRPETNDSSDIVNAEHVTFWAQLDVRFSTLHDMSALYVALADVRVLLRDTAYGKAAPVQVTLVSVVSMREAIPLKRVNTWQHSSLPRMHRESLYYPCVAL